MSTFKYICGVILLLILLEMPYSTIFPFMDYEEYFVDDYNEIHNKNCPMRDVPWFTRKRQKYDFLMERDTEFCMECFMYEEEEKLKILHGINMQIRISQLQRNGASDDYIKKFIEKHY